MKFRFTPNQKRELFWWAGNLEETALPQGTGALKIMRKEEGPCFCCLGIYAECRVPEEFVNDGYLPNSYAFLRAKKGKTRSEKATSYLPDYLGRKLGFTENRNSELESAFTQLNDGYKYSFKEIAQEIRHLVEHGDFTPETTKLFYG